MIIMTNYYYILNNAKIYSKHFKRLNFYKNLKKDIRINKPQSIDAYFHALSRTVNRIIYGDFLHEIKRKQNSIHNVDTVYTMKTSADMHIHQSLLQAFEIHYRSILSSLTIPQLCFIFYKCQDNHVLQKETFKSTYMKIIRRRYGIPFDVFFK
ncbi:hypothetical protein PGO_060300 [Plasmodium gonderi]|uniref:Uncharacterized protein n=1 Tax=Plasmodium gonderi TaxID=77519 RepID=A0A1Y1JBL8_PLAGO|nr:hypothetical protein PGO_060300 [Plasmodium gonderi]GAW79886.1 hypothetical protein PGO_060300 [Plasmodium gonderi]